MRPILYMYSLVSNDIREQHISEKGWLSGRRRMMMMGAVRTKCICALLDNMQTQQ